MDHIGIDVHKRESQIYILAEGGEVIERRIRTEPERFDAVLGTRPRARIVLEASTDSEWVARCLEGLGHEVIVADPNFAPMYATRSRKVKTDRRDARALAEACLLGAYRPAHRLSDPQRHVRGRLVVRDALVRRARATSRSSEPCSASTATASPPAVPRTLSTAFRAFPCRAGCARSSRHCSRSCVPSTGQLTYSDATIEHLAVQDPRVPRLRSVPSIGPVTAAAFLAAIDDAQRFRHAHQLEAYLGLVPAEHSSGETQRRGAITKAGHSRTRWLLIQAAVSILRRRPPQAEELRTWARASPRAGETGGRGRPRPSPRRHPLCPAARWQCVRAPARSVTRAVPLLEPPPR